VTGLPGAKHATYGAALRVRPELAGYWSFGFVRNPWARLWSWYQMIERRQATAERGNAWVAQRIERNDFWSGVLEHCPDFDSFVMEGTQRFDRLRRPQLDYLRDGDRQVDFIGRTENLAEDITAVGERCGFERIPIDTLLTDADQAVADQAPHDALMPTVKPEAAPLTMAPFASAMSCGNATRPSLTPKVR